MSVEKNNENLGSIDSVKLLEELAVDIAKKFGIEKEKAEALIKQKTLSEISSLREELKDELKNNDKFKENNLEELFFSLKGAREIIENSSKIEIKVLKEDVEKTINIEEFKNTIDDYLPPKLIERAKNPTAPHEHILGFALGTTNSIVATVEILYQIGKGILQTPYHLYMIITGKGKSNSFKNI